MNIKMNTTSQLLAKKMWQEFSREGYLSHRLNKNKTLLDQRSAVKPKRVSIWDPALSTGNSMAFRLLALLNKLTNKKESNHWLAITVTVKETQIWLAWADHLTDKSSPCLWWDLNIPQKMSRVNSPPWITCKLQTHYRSSTPNWQQTLMYPDHLSKRWRQWMLLVIPIRGCLNRILSVKNQQNNQ